MHPTKTNHHQHIKLHGKEQQCMASLLINNIKWIYARLVTQAHEKCALKWNETKNNRSINEGFYMDMAGIRLNYGSVILGLCSKCVNGYQRDGSSSMGT